MALRLLRMWGQLRQIQSFVLSQWTVLVKINW